MGARSIGEWSAREQRRGYRRTDPHRDVERSDGDTTGLSVVRHVWRNLPQKQPTEPPR
jgi:hypothetical protein